MDHTSLNVDNYDGRFTWRCGGRDNEPIVYDVEGVGGTPNGRNIRYLGALVLLRPDTFLDVAMPLEMPRERTESYLPTVAYDRGISPPMLYLREIAPVVLRSGRQVRFAVVGHEGRHRARFVRRLGCERMPTQIVIEGLRARHIDKELLDALEVGVIEEKALGHESRYPWSFRPFPFVAAFVNGERYLRTS